MVYIILYGSCNSYVLCLIVYISFIVLMSYIVSDVMALCDMR